MARAFDRLPADYQELTELLHDAVAQARFNPSASPNFYFGGYSSSQFREMYYNPTSSIMEFLRLFGTPVLPSEMLTSLTDRLQPLLEPFVIDNCVGDGLALFVGGIPDPPLAHFAVDLVRVAVLDSPERASLMLYKWADGEDLSFRICAVLSGITVDQPLEMDGGIRFESLPEHVEEYSDHLPFTATYNLSPSELSRAVKVILECKSSPALYVPGEYDTAFEQSYAYGPLPKGLITKLCQALSLTLNQCVTAKVVWKDSDEVGLLGRKIHAECVYPEGDINASDAAKFTPEHLPDLQACVEKLLVISHERRKLSLAIRRWMLSKRHTSLADQFIELRIALEALYLENAGSELGFRIANFGAWHLGADFDQRRKHLEVLRRAYSLSSRAVHAGEVKDTAENVKLLTAAQDLCRDGILKRLSEDAEPNWVEMSLGKGIDS